MMRIISADWVFPPGEAPIEKGALLLHGDTLLDMGSPEKLAKEADGAQPVRIDGFALIPGLVNCHTHLELSGFDRIPGDGGFPSWIRSLMTQKQGRDEEKVLEEAETALHVMTVMGTAYVADASSDARTSLALIRSGVSGTVFREHIGLGADAHEEFRRTLPQYESEAIEGVRILPACHAPYSAAPELLEAVSAWSRENDCPTMLHLAESEDEHALFSGGGGALRDFLLGLGVSPERVPSAAEGGPVAYLDGLSFLNERTLLVHLVQAGKKDIETIRARGAKPCLCPSSNLHLTGKLPPVRAMLDAGLKPCLGTDSPASGASLNLFHEMAILLDQGIEPETVLAMGTLHGRDALRLPPDFGAFEIGARPSVLALPVDGEDGRPPLESALRAAAQGWMKWVVRPGGSTVIAGEWEEAP